MCFILMLLHANDRYPLIVAANRDESRARASRAPHRWADEQGIWAGRDEVAGGTWLGVNDHGLLAAITNRRNGKVDPSLPSRGALCLGALRRDSVQAAASFVETELENSRFNPFNLLCASVAEALVTTWEGKTRRLDPGIHVVTNEGDADDMTLPRVARGFALAEDVDHRASLDELFSQLGRICSDQEGPAPICRPGGERGTVSSSLIALTPEGRLAAYWHADGPPSEKPYIPVDLSPDEQLHDT